MGGSDCSCGNTAVSFIFPCSGAADVGELADRAARRLSKEGKGKMFCLAGIGGGVSGIIESARAADTLVVIDGCPVDCAKKTMEKAGLTGFKYLKVTDLGFEKGKTAVSEENIAAVADRAAGLLPGKGGCCGG